ncbi:MAG: IclR family transcriptional regulator [Chloroflexi bacterium]|nr:IclR family transcriptional regulator [Chloroflexota bacterium]
MSSGLKLIPEGAEESNTPVSYIYRAFKVLEILAVTEATPEQIAKKLYVHKRTAQRLLDTMVAAGFVTPDRDDSQRYTLTMKVIAIAGSFYNRNSLIRIAHPYVSQLRDLTSESVNFAVPDHGRHMVLIHERSPYLLKGGPDIGSPGPMHASSLGKTLLAYLPQEFEAACRTDLKRFTSNTIISHTELAAHLSQVRVQGYAIDNEEQEIGLRCIGAPVWDHTGKVVASISITGPTQRIIPEKIPHLTSQLLATAQELSQALGYDEFLRLQVDLSQHD